MNKQRLFWIISAILICLIVTNVQAEVKHWIGTGIGTGALWNVAANWSPAGTPTFEDDVILDGGGNLTINTNASCFSFLQVLSPGTQDFTNNASLTVGLGGLRITGGQLKMNASNNFIAVSGDWTQEGGTFNAGTGTVKMIGAGVKQTITTFSPFWNLLIDNIDGVDISSDLEIGGQLSLVNGILTTDPYSLLIKENGTVNRTAGHVYGNMAKWVSDAFPTVTYEIGDDVNYTPVTVDFDAVTIPGSLMLESFTGDHPLVAFSPIDQTKSVNRFWIFSNSGIEFSSYNATFNFVPEDLDPTVNPDEFIVSKIDLSSWEMPAIGVRTATSTQALGMTTMSDFAVGEIKKFPINQYPYGNGYIDPGGAMVNYGADQLFQFIALPGNHIDSVFIDGNYVGSPTEWLFTNVTTPHAVKVKFIEDTLFVNATAGANGTIDPSGNVPYLPHANASFTITPSGGYHILDVLVDGSSIGAVNYYNFENVLTNHTIHATFSIDQYSIFSTATEGGDIIPGGTAILDSGAVQQYVMIPWTGYHLDTLFVDGLHVDSTSSYTFTNIHANHTIHAQFLINSYTIAASAGSNGSIEPSGMVHKNYGESQQFVVTPNYGYHTDSLFVDGLHVDSTSSYTFYNIISDHSIDAKFALNQYTILAGATSGGAITPSGAISIYHGGSQNFLMTPDVGYHIDTLFVDGLHVDSTSSYTFSNVNGNHSIFAKYMIDMFTINATYTQGGYIEPAGDVSIPYGSNQNFGIVPSIGYYLDSLFVDGSHVDSTTSYTFYNVVDNHTIHAQFKITMFTITSSSGPNGTIAPLGSVQVPYGSNQQYVMTPNYGYHLDSLIVDGLEAKPFTPFTFEGVTGNHTIRAVYRLNDYTISASATSGGTITPSGDIIVAHGGSQKFIILTNTGYHLDTLFVDGIHVDSSSSYTFTNVVMDHSIHAKIMIDVFQIIATSGLNGNIEPSGNVMIPYGSDQTFTFLPNKGYYVDSVFVDGSYIGNGPNYTFLNVTAPHTIHATFAIYAYTITASAGTGGSINPSGIVGVNYGATRQFTITPNTGYHIDTVYVDGIKVDSTTSYTFYDITENHTIHVSFRANVYTITATAEGLGIIIPNGFIAVNHGATQRFYMVPTFYGFEVVELLIDGVPVDSTSSYTFYNVTDNHTIHAIFGQRVHPVPTLTNIHPTGGYRGDSLVVIFVGSNFLPGITSVYVGTGLSVNYIEFFPGSTDSMKASIKINYNAVVGIRNFYVTNSPPGGGPSETIQFNVLDKAPTAARLISPLNRDSLTIPEIENLIFAWESSTDADLIDTVKYSLHIWGADYDSTVNGLASTTVMMQLSKLMRNSWYNWTVSATDGYLITASPDTFMFYVKFTDGVKDIAGIPTEFTLRQNYPNPFNPTTNIRFELPNEAVVTIKVYNTIGTEIATLLDHRTLQQGIKEVTFDANGFASGVYFCRFYAEALDGKQYISTKKMVLMK
ncbi:MAG: T9SS type A sorting domain-containing protein [Ignavibacteriales bacterium]|nr:T9SS type A sorting domain-containing protein [Ignavibacteriales bacterium]